MSVQKTSKNIVVKKVKIIAPSKNKRTRRTTTRTQIKSPISRRVKTKNKTAIKM